MSALRRSPRLGVERLEDRTLLDGGGPVQIAAAGATDPSAIVVGRVQSSYFAEGVTGHQLTITYTVYNEQADPESGVLLTTTLAPGVTYASSSAVPDRQGQALAWSLGTIQGYDRASVTLTVNLPATTPSQVDTGAHAFATLDADPVTNTTPAATLRAGTPPDPSLLASTPDANTTDPFIQEEAAKLDYDPQQIFDFLHNEIGYNSYTGSLRGARGTLWSSAGNALDVASLGVALMRASGIPAQYVQGNLSFNQAQQLILSMFPPSFQTVGFIPSGTTTANPANDPQLLSETESHSWFRFDAGNGMQDADPLMAGATIGQTFTTSTGTFAEVPDAMRHKTTIELHAEITGSAAVAFGLGPQTTTVLSQTLNDVDLVGVPLTVGNFVSSGGIGTPIFSVNTITYSPYLRVGSNSANLGSEALIRGQDFQEVLTNFPLGSQVLTGLFLDIDLSGPSVAPQHFERTLVDRVGIAARRSGSGSISFDPGAGPAIDPLDLTTIGLFPGLQDPRSFVAIPAGAAPLADQLRASGMQLQGMPNPGPEQDALLNQAAHQMSDLITLFERSRLIDFAVRSDFSARLLARSMNVAAYADSPRLIIVSSKVQTDAGSTPALRFSVDLLRDNLRVIAAPITTASATVGFQVQRGIIESVLEGDVLNLTSGTPDAFTKFPVSTPTIFQAAEDQGIAVRVLTPNDLQGIDGLALSANAKALITDALRVGKYVAVPERAVTIGGGPTVGWYEVDLNTGETTSVLEDGSHGSGSTELTGSLFIATTIARASTPAGRFLAGFLVGLVQGNIVPLLIGVALAAGTGTAGLPSLATGSLLLFTKNAIRTARARALSDPFIRQMLAFAGPAFRAGFFLGFFSSFLLRFDPSVPSGLVNLDLALPENTASQDVARASTVAAGQVQGMARVPSIEAAGNLQADWRSGATGGFRVATLASQNATVLDSNGNTVGSGAVALATSRAVAVTVSGDVLYHVTGQGTLAFYAPATTNLGVSSVWDRYTASLSGGVTLRLTSDALSLNGIPLPAGSYTLMTSSATLSGDGPSTSPNFVGSASVNASGAAIHLGPAAGTVAVGGVPFDLGQGATLTGYDGTVSVVAGADADTVDLQGSAAHVLRVSGDRATLTTDQNTPLEFNALVQTSLADTFTITAEAPAGWTIAIDQAGKVTATPAPGLQGGTFPIHLVARSKSDPNLVAQGDVMVTITPTQPGVALGVQPEPLITVPFGGAEVPTAFSASIRNTGPAVDTFNLTFANIPGGFTLLNSGTRVTVPAGQTGILGLYLQPNPGQTLPAPGTKLSFSVTATSTTTSTITQTQTVTLTVPAIDAVTVTSTLASVATTPGVGVTDTITITNVGNVAENNITLKATLPNGLTLTGLAPVSLAVGESTTETITLTPAASTALNSILQATITVTYGPAATPQSQSLTLPVNVVVPGAAAIARASVAANLLNNTGLAGRLNDLSTALTNLVQNPTSAVFKGQAQANLTSLISQITNDPFLSGFTAGLVDAQAALGAATTASQIQQAVSNLGTALDSLAATITDDAAHGFSLSLTPDRQVVQPGAPEVFDLVMTNNGNAPTTYDLSVTGMPAGASAVFSQPSVTLQPGQTINGGSNPVTLTITESGATLVAANFNVTATAEGASEIAQTTPGLLTLRNESFVVAGVTATPPFTNPGGKVAVSAQVQGTVNEPTTVLASYVVTDPGGKTLFTSAATPVSLTTTSALTTVDLGTLDTTGFALGTDTITVRLADSAGRAIAGASGTASLFLGQPVTGTLTTAPATVPTGSSRVTTTLSVTTQASFPDPLTLQGAASAPAPGTSVALFPSGGKLFAYESGTGGIDALDVTDPTNPELLEVFGQNDITNGKFGFNVAKVVNGELIVGTSNGNNGSVFNLLVYSLADPSAPTLVSNTAINYRFLSDLLVNSTGTAAFVPTNGFFYSGNSIFQDFGDFVSIDLTDPTQPALAGSLFDMEPQPQGGDMNQFGGTLVNDQIAYSAGISPGGGTIISNTGNLLVVNIADPKNMKLLEQLKIPGTINILDVAVHGNRALVVGTAGTESNVFNPNSTGVMNNLTLTVLDVSDPANPKVLGSTFVTNQQFPLNEAGAKTDVVDLGNGDFAVSDTDNNGNPSLVVVDPTDPSNIIVGAARVPSGVHGITVSGSELYASTSSGLSIYHIEPLVSDPVTFTVDLPAGGAAAIVPNSFNIAPTAIHTSASGDTLVWDRSFAAGATTYTFDWQTNVSGVTAGQALPVTTGATASYTSQGTPGTLTLPGTSVSGVSIVSLTPATSTEQPGGSATYDVRLTNPTSAAVTYNLSAVVPDYNVQTTLPEYFVTVPAGGVVDVPLTLTSYATAPSATDTVTVTAEGVVDSADGQTQLADYKGAATASLTIAGQPVVQPNAVAFGVVVALSPASATLGQGGSATYVVQLTNVGSADDSYNLAINGLPSGVFDSFGSFRLNTNGFGEVPAGASNSRDLTLTLTSFPGTPVPAGSYPFTVTAASNGGPNDSGSAQGTLVVVNGGVSVFLDPNTVSPGGSYQMTVTNTGTVADTYNLALGGPAALVAKLGKTTVSLAPGDSQVVPITTGGVDFAIPGALPLMGVATSTADPSVTAAATASLQVPATSGLTAQFSPASRSLATAGPASFLLTFDNTGNVEDAYSATIVGTTGPVAAALMGLDGVPSQTIPVLRLPGLSRGALDLMANIFAAGSGTITVRIQSLNDPSRSEVVTATLAASQAATLATSTKVSAAPNPAGAGQSLALIATVEALGGVGTPSGTVTFAIDGKVVGSSSLQVVDGVDEAVLTTTAPGAGSHQVTATYRGFANFAGSAGQAPLNVVPAASTTTLTVAPGTAPDQYILTATVIGPVAATGTVLFADNGTIIGNVPVGPDGKAVLTTTLPPGTAALLAYFAGDPDLQPSGTSITTLAVPGLTAPSPSPQLAPSAPQVTGVDRMGYHAIPTTLVLHFGGPLDPARAQDLNNYRLVGPRGRRVAIAAAVYGPQADTVTLYPASRLNVHARYRLTVVGGGPDGLTDPFGVPLAGAGTPGTDAVLAVDWNNLVFAPGTPARILRFPVEWGRRFARVGAAAGHALSRPRPPAGVHPDHQKAIRPTGRHQPN